jgi:hypothetical protein
MITTAKDKNSLYPARARSLSSGSSFFSPIFESKFVCQSSSVLRAARTLHTDFDHRPTKESSTSPSGITSCAPTGHVMMVGPFVFFFIFFQAADNIEALY